MAVDDGTFQKLRVSGFEQRGVAALHHAQERGRVVKLLADAGRRERKCAGRVPVAQRRQLLTDRIPDDGPFARRERCRAFRGRFIGRLRCRERDTVSASGSG